MDFHGMTLIAGGGPSTLLAHQTLDHIVPYVILLINCLLFKLMRNLINRIVNSITLISNDHQQKILTGKTRLLKLFIDELISTCELCADCAELNVVYEKHGSYSYGLALFVLSYIWIDSFGDTAYTSPGYLAEEYFLIEGNSLLKTGDAYVRFIGQSLAMPLAWRMANIYWRYQLISEHRGMADTENCKSSLATSTMNGFLIEFACCMLCRLTELIGHKLLEKRHLSQRMVSCACSFINALLVVLALESSGGYFHPILAASLEYGCKGIKFHQHALVFWLGPLLGHLLARSIYLELNGVRGESQKPVTTATTTTKTTTTPAERRRQILSQVASERECQRPKLATNQGISERTTRSNSQRKKKTD